MIYVFLMILAFIGAMIGTVIIAHNRATNKSTIKAKLLVAACFVVLAIAVTKCCDEAMKPSPYASKDFNEWTGEPKNKTPFGY